ncbi:MAG: pirin family protein [Xanthomonadales bacterium]
MRSREIRKTISARATSDGAGVKILRLTGFSESLRMDPFLMLDEIRSDDKDDFIAGFPAHPHRGFETITYMRDGGFSHRDSMGNSGQITSGGAQWMKAASGVIHSEMPVAGANNMHGFQFWLNLPAAEKMDRPEYRDIQGDEVVEVTHGDALIRLIAGSLGLGGRQVDGVVTGGTTRPLLIDIDLPAGASVSVEYDSELHSQFYVYKGSVTVAGQMVPRGQLAYLGDGEQLDLSAGEDAGLLLFGGKPINEAVAHYGPYVMNTEEELEQAVRDYQEGRLVDQRHG